MESDDLSQRVLDYFHKIKTSEVMWCEDHDREFLEGEKCPGCEGDCEHNYESYGSEMLSQVSHAAPLFPSDKQFGRCE